MQKLSFSDFFAARVVSNECEKLATQSAPIELDASLLAHVGGGVGPNGTWTEAATTSVGPNGTW